MMVLVFGSSFFDFVIYAQNTEFIQLLISWKSKVVKNNDFSEN